MDNKIQELTDKLYQEGVEKGNQEAQSLIAKAQEEAAAILEKARKDAETINHQAKKDADELAENTKKELQMYAAQAVNALKSEITTLVSQSIVEAPVKEFASKKEYLQKFIVEMASKWSADEPVVIATKDAEELTKYFKVSAKTLLDDKVKITKVNGVDTLFTIGPADGSYKVSFGEEELVNYFQAFLRPRLVEMLFGTK